MNKTLLMGVFLFMDIILLGNLDMKNKNKFNIPFAEGLGTAPSGRTFTPFLFLRTKKGRVPKGRSPLQWVVGWNPTELRGVRGRAPALIYLTRSNCCFSNYRL